MTDYEMNSYEILQIALGKELKITYDTGNKIMTMKSGELPAQSFFDAVRKLADAIIPDSKGTKLYLGSMRLTKDKHDMEFLTIGAAITTTDMKWRMDGKLEKICLEDSMEIGNAWDVLCVEARRYINGHTGEVSLFEGAGNGKEKS